MFGAPAQVPSSTWTEGARWPEARPIAVPGPAGKKKRWPLYAAIAGAAVVVGIVIAIATRPSPPPPDDHPESKFAHDAYAALQSGDLKSAQQILDQNKQLVPADGLAMLVQGLIDADADAKQWPAALELFRKALRRDGNLATDPKLRANLRAMAGAPDSSEAIIADALDVWLATGDDEAIKSAGLAAVAPDNPTRRHAAKAAIDRHKDLVKVDWLKAYALDLQSQPTCTQRKDALAQLHALGDPRAVPVIQEALKLPRKRLPREGGRK